MKIARLTLAAFGVVPLLVLGLAAPAQATGAPSYDPGVDNSAFPYRLDPANDIDGGRYAFTTDPLANTGQWESTAMQSAPDVSIDRGCPEGYRSSSRTFIVTASGATTGLKMREPNPDAPAWGLEGNPIYLPEFPLGTWQNLTPESNPSGTNALVITCDPPAGAAGAPTATSPIGNAKYFFGFFKGSWEQNRWDFVPRTAPKSDTTTVLAVASVKATSLTLTATVAPAAATGTVQFTQGGVNVGSAVEVTNGVASLAVSGLAPGTAYSFRASYSGDSAYNASEGSADATTPPDGGTPTPGDSSSTEISVGVPEATDTAPTGLSISVKPQPLALSSTDKRVKGSVWIATGALGTVTVNDDRRSAAKGWTLNGKISDLTSGTSKIPASNLGWTPARVDGAGSAGEAVAPGSNGGLGSEKTLVTGAGDGQANVKTSVKADLKLSVPADAPSGKYSGVLTLTLI